jgi:3-deoxy-D-manno-octulosonic-acid transferase
LLHRQRNGKEHPERHPERRGIASVARPEGPLVWLHGASVGETISILTLVDALLKRGFRLLVTSGTVTSAEVLAKRLPAEAIHQFMPLDVPRYMRRFLDHWRPNLALIAESEIWPTMMIEAHRRGLPLVLVNARMSERSFRRWQKAGETARALLSSFDLCLAQSLPDAERLARLGAPRALDAGNLKFDVPPPPADPATLALLEGMTGGRVLWVAASTHAGEDEHIITAHKRMAPYLRDLLTIIVPRHPSRGGEVADLARLEGLRVAQRSIGQQPERDCDIYVADTIGELGLFYRLSPVVYMGGSLVPHGGQNPIEPAKLGAAILHGPHVHNFTPVFAALDQRGGARQINDAEELARGAFLWLNDPATNRVATRAAGHAVAEVSGALERTMQSLEPLLYRAQIESARTPTLDPAVNAPR